MIDYMFGRGDVMLYPSAPADPCASPASQCTGHVAMSFSTTYMERGDHSGTDAVIEKSAANQLRPIATYDLRKTVPLLRWEHASLARAAMQRLPPFGKLPVINLHHKREPSLATLQQRGTRFVSSRAAAAAKRQRTGGRAASEDDGRPATQHPGSPVATTSQYEQLQRLWLCGLEDMADCTDGMAHASS